MAAVSQQSSSLGDTGGGWYAICRQLAADLPHTRIVLPTAPERPISKFSGQRMTAWFDIPPPDAAARKQDAAGLHDSRRYVESLLQEQAAAGVPSSRIVVGGFSQGAAVALLALRSQHRLAGVLALSGFLPLANESPLLSEANAQTPVLMCHGDADQMIVLERARASEQALAAAAANFEFRLYPGMGHHVRDDEMQDVRRFLAATLAQQ